MEKYPLVRIRNIKVLIMYYVKILIFIFSCFFIVACGLKGPLYMPVQKSVENKGDVDKKATTKIEESKQTSKVVLDDSNVKIDNPLLIENIIDTELDGELIEEKDKLEVNEDNKNESIKSDKNKQ
jgi:predicted small lipoprotein YifL